MKQTILSVGALSLLVACTQPPANTDDSEGCTGSVDGDGDGITDCDELELGLDPESPDSDGDGDEDGAELDCGADPLDSEELCYACGWHRGDPGDLESTGDGEGDVIENLEFVDQCGEEVDLWDFAGEYHILWMTAAW